MKKTRQEPVFLLEMPFSLRHMIMRRGVMLRGRRTRTRSCMNKGGPKAWLEAKLIASAGETTDENWDKAHELAGKFKGELHTDVYVEPACQFGRYMDLTAPHLASEGEAPSNVMAPEVASSFGAGSSFGPPTGPAMSGAFGPGFGVGRSSGDMNPFAMGSPGMHMPGMPHIPDPMKDILPPQVRQMMGMGGSSAKDSRAKRPEIVFPAIKDLPGWSELPISKQLMFEVEAAQLHQSGHVALGSQLGVPSDISHALVGSTIETEKALAALSVHPKASGALKAYLLESFEAATAR